ncbi:MAG: VWA domain-containing protein [Isosphaeraceae bacterium]
MEWQHPQWLYLILPLAAAWLVLSLYSRRQRRRAAEAFVAQSMWTRILPPDSLPRFWVKLLLRESAIVAGLVALAGPRFGTHYEDVVPRGSDLYVLLDVSKSMLAEDVPPSRLARAKADVAALVNRLEGERIGLIAFAGQAVVKCPLTVDYDAFRRSLDELDPGSAPRGGTAIGDAIRKALEVFQAKAERDQAILLITDGDDQQSYPLEAASVAAERHVTIFTVGLGDADHGARIPQNAEAKSYVEYKGQQVWSKLDNTLLKEIALKTSGVYVPVGTRAYDLGELYAKYLQGKRGGDGQTQKRIRRSDQFQVFLALALLALLIDALVRPDSATVKELDQKLEPRARTKGQNRARSLETATSVTTALVLIAALCGTARADNPVEAVREGLRSYGKGEFDKAKEKFAAAQEQFGKTDADKAAIAAYDEACAAHRKGDVAQAREQYLKAGLAHDKTLAAAAHFNLGTLAAQEANKLAGEHPENVAPEKRAEILEQLKAAVASFRHCLELQPDNSQARHDIELVRQWIKVYSDRWQALDREKRRREMNLVAYLEFLIETQRALRESVRALSTTSPADAYAEPKRLQDELRDEITPLREKIKDELTPRQPQGAAPSAANAQQLEKGIALLQGWATGAGEKMVSASERLDERQAKPAAEAQQAAIAELEKIWDAVIPFHALLARDLADQTRIARALAPEPPGEAKSKDDQSSASKAPSQAGTKPSPPAAQPSLRSESEDLSPLTESQERTLRRTKLLKLKAEAELARVDKQPQPSASPGNAQGPAAKPVDPKQLKQGYQKAIDLAPRAAEKMQEAVQALNKKVPQAAYPPAEEARKILEEIQKAQPRNERQDQKKDQQKQKDQDKKDEAQKKQDRQQQDQQKKQEQEKSGEQKKEEKKPREQASRDRIEEALRKVRERQKEKRERDRRMNLRLFGRAPVEKDW